MSDKQSSVLEVEKGSVEGTIEKVPEDDGIDPVAEKKLVKKLDWIFLPLFTVICRSRISWVAQPLISSSQTASIMSTGSNISLAIERIRCS